jgi:choline dehydrogenase-like flavoprotein
MICRYVPFARYFLRIKVKGNFQLNLFVEILNTPENAIELNKNLKKLQINFNLTEADRAEISKIVTGYFEGLGELFKTNLPDSIHGLFGISELHSAQSGSHPSGTYRMSVSPNEGIINPNSELHRHRNIFVLGAGGFPRSAATHPTFTAMALAVLSVNSIPWKNTSNILGGKWGM